MGKNYLDNAMNIKFEKAEQYKLCNDSCSNCSVRVTICGKCYKDPDESSRALYEDIADYFSEKFGHALTVSGKNRLLLKYDNLYEHHLSTDYIGPSRKWAVEYLWGNDDEKELKIGEFLLWSRTIGGHIFWPAHQVNRCKTINQVKGGRGIYDRIDVTLAELKNYFDTKGEGKANYYKPLYEAFGRYKWFFDIFNWDFNAYIKVMVLDDFLNENEEVISLTDSELDTGIIKPIVTSNDYTPKNYELYIKNCKNLIEKRTNKIIG